MATYISSGTSAVSNGKTLVDPIITQTGRVVVSNGGTLSGAIASNGGQVQISSGGTDKDSFYMNGGVLIISSGGLCSAPSIQQGATVNISAGRLLDAFISKATVSVWNSSGTSLGYVSHATLYGGATMTLGYYGMASDTILSAGSLTVNGGKIQSTTVLSGTSNRVTVLNGGSAHITNLSSGAEMFVSLYASATTNKIYSGATLYLGGSAQYTSVMGGTIIVSKTGRVSATYISSGGSLYVAGSANEVTVSNGGKFEANGSAWTTNVTVSSGGAMIAGSGTVIDLTVYNGTVSAIAGARVSKATFHSGKLEVKSAGTVTSLTLDSGASAIVSNGGSASITELNSNAQLILSHGLAISANVNTAGKITVSSGGEAKYTTINTSGSMAVSMGGRAYVVTVNDSATLTLYGFASSATLNSGASLYIGSGGSMESATVGAGANVTIAANGKGYSLVEDGGYVDVNTNGTATFGIHTFTGAVQSATVHKGTTASNVTVSKRLDVFSGGTALNTSATGSGAFIIVNNGGKANYTSLTGTSSYLTLSSGASASHAVLYNSKARLNVSSGGSVNEIIVFSGATATIFGSAFDATIHSGYLEVSSGATATSATALDAGAYIVVYSGGRANYTSISNATAAATIYSSGTATDTTVIAGSLTILNSGNAELTTVINGFMNLNGGFATSTVVKNTGTMNVNANGIATSTTVSSGGTLFVNSYGSATSNSVSKGGSMAILSAGSVRYTSVFSGGEFSVSRGGFASTTVVSDGGKFTVSSGGRATYSLVRDGGSMTVMNGGSASDINLDGSLFVHGVADSAQVNGAGAAMTVFNGGSAVNAVVGNGAALTVSSGGKITGRLVTTAEAVVSAYAGAILDFDLTKTEAGADALVNNLSIFTGATPSLTLTVDGTVADGEYKLANGASGFTGSVSVVNNSGTALGTLVLDSIVTVDGRNYLLSKNGSTLTVTIAGGSGAFVFSGELNDAEKNLAAGVSAVNVSVNRDAFLNILNGAKASDTTVNEGGKVTVYEGGSGSGVTVNSGGEFYVNDGGVATDILENGGYVSVPDDYAPGAFLPNTLTGMVLEGDGDSVWATVHSGTVANQTTINQNGNLVVVGGVANDTTVNKDGRLQVWEKDATANNTTVNNGGVFENYNGVLKNTTINDGGVGSFNLYGVASNTTVKAGGTLEYSGKMTGKITFEEGAVITADEYAVLDFDLTQTAPDADALLNNLSAIKGETPLFTLTVDGTEAIGEYRLADGAEDFYETIRGMNTAGTEIGVLEREEIVTIGDREYLLYKNDSTLFVTLGGVSNFTGDVTTRKNLLSGMSATDMNVNEDGVLNVYSGGKAGTALVNANGVLTVSSGGSADGITVNPGGELYVEEGGVATGILENGGYVGDEVTVTFLPNTFSGVVLDGNGNAVWATVHSGTVAKQTTINQNGILAVYDGGIANATAVNDGGLLQINSEGRGVANNTTVNNGGIFISYEGEANDTTVNGGGLFTAYFGTANGTTVSEGGLFALYSDGTASNTTVKAGGEIQFLGKLTGRTIIETGATAYIEHEGAVLDFDLTQTTTGADALLNDMSAIQGEKPKYTLTVDGTQDAGDYKLAGGAAGFTGSLTVLNTSGMELGTLTVDGGSLQTALGEYSLSLNDGVLTATVAAEVAPDTTKPTVSNIAAGTTDPTNQDVVVTAEFKDDVELKSALYRIGEGGAWQDYNEGGVTVTENTTVYFKAIDAADNESDIASCTVSNIDRVAPAKPTASADVTSPTNQDVTVTAEFSEDSAKREFSTDGKNWQDYKEGGVIIIINGTVSFRGIDEAGNVSEVTSLEVNNIDKVAPAKPTASADVTEPTNGSVFVSAVFSEDSVRKQYSRDEVNWLPYEGAVKFTGNGTAYFRGIDAAGNVSDVTSVEVGNIEAVVADTTPPTVSDVTASTEDPTNQDVTVTAVFADDVELKSSLYNIDGGEWLDYKGGVTVSENTTVNFKAVDAAGNESGTVAYKVTNIDKVAPTITGITPDTTEPAESVTLTATFEDNVKLASRQFKIGGGGAWMDYTAGVTVSENDTVYFRAVDTAGNETETSYEVTNIEVVATDTTPPVVTNMQASITAYTNQDVIVTAEFTDDVGVVSKLYNLNNGEWQAYPDGGVVVKENNTTVYFQAIDAAGNKSEIDGYKVSNIDKVAPTVTITPSTTEPAKSVDLVPKFTDNGKLATRQYRIGDGVWQNYTDVVVTVTENTTVYFKAVDAAGNETIESCTVTNIDGSTPAKGLEEPANDWLYDKKSKKVNAALTESDGTRLASSDASAEIFFDATPSETLSNFVGQNGDGTLDECDYVKVVLPHAAELGFSIDYTDAAKFAIWQLVPGKKEGEYTTKSTAITLKNKDATRIGTGTKSFRLEAGEYYLSMQSTNAKKGGKNEYSVRLSNAVFFDLGDNSDDWTNMKTVGFGPGAEIDDLGVVDENGALVSNGWTGFGDAVDYKKITLTTAGKLNFEFSTHGSDNLKISVCQLKSTEKKGVVTYSQGWNKAVTVKAKDSAGSLNGLLLEAGEYCIKVENTNAKKSSGTEYGIKVAQSEFYTDGDSGANNYDSKADRKSVV